MCIRDRAKALMEREKLNEQEFNTVMAGGTLAPRDSEEKQPQQAVDVTPAEPAEKAETAETAEPAAPVQDPAPADETPKTEE